MATLQRKKTEMVGSLILPAEMMSQQNASSPNVVQVTHGPSSSATEATLQQFGQDLQKSVNLQKRKTEMYGTLIVDAMDHAGDSAPRKDAATTPPDSPSGTSDGSGNKKTSKWSEPMDEEMLQDLEAMLGL